MSKSSFFQILWIGFTLFSMFFGAGNLIFAPYLGVQAGQSAGLALAGFICTAVVLPIGAVVVISRYRDAVDMMAGISLGFARFFMALIYLLIGPAIAIPRTASTSYEMFLGLLPDSLPTRIVYTVLFFGLCFLTAWRPGKLKDILGKFMGPILIGMILVLCFAGLLLPCPDAAPATAAYTHAFTTGFFEGYQTMDILAAFCFGIVILLNIQQAGFATNQQRSILQKAALIAGVLLGSLYAMLAFTGMKFSAEFQALPNGAQILAGLARMEFGPPGSVLISLIFLIACYNVCSGLLSCCAEFFYELSGKGTYLGWLLLFVLSGIAVAIGGLDTILALSAPILGWICPIAVILLGYGLLACWFPALRLRRQ